MTDTITSNAVTKHCSEQIIEYRGRITRLAMLLTHYRQPLNWTEARWLEAETILGKWLAVAQATDDEPPADVLEALGNDLNTPAAIMLISRYAKQKEGKKVYAAMKLLGFISDN